MEETRQSLAYTGQLGPLKSSLEALLPDARQSAICAADEDGRTLLSWACAGGHGAEVIPYLIENAGAKLTRLVNRADESGMTPLCSAAASGDTKAMELLLHHGADPNARTEGGQIALSYHKGRVPVIKALAPVSQVDAQDKAGQTALHRAAGPGYTLAVEALIEAGCKLNLKDRNGNTALLVAAEEGRMEVFKTLLDHGADPKVKNAEGKDCLSIIVDPLIREQAIEILRRAIAEGNGTAAATAAPGGASAGAGGR